MDISRDNGLVVDLEYEPKAPYEFTGTVKQVTFDLKPAIQKTNTHCTSTRASTRSRTASAPSLVARPTPTRAAQPPPLGT